jgi:bifunctional enzyme CysN/CysC
VTGTDTGRSPNVVWHPGDLDRSSRSLVTGGPGLTVWLTGLSGSGKSTIAHAVERRLVESGRAAYVLDGDNVRHGLNGDLGFSPGDRAENVRRVAEVARLMADAGLVVLVPVISPYRVDRAAARTRHEVAGLGFLEVFVDTPIEVCEERDPKGLYRLARTGGLTDFTGIDAPYEAPLTPDLVISTVDRTTEECATELLQRIDSIRTAG